MKNFLNLGVNAPLTLNLGHPVKMRLEQLQYVGKRKRKIPVVIGLSILMASTISPVRADTDEVNREAALPATQNTLENASLPSALKQEHLAQLSPNVVSPTLQAARSQAMRLRMRPRYTTAQTQTVKALRLKTPDLEFGGRKAVRGEWLNMSFLNQYEVRIDNAGQGQLVISSGTGTWPDRVPNPADWVERPMSQNMRRGLQTIIDRCAQSAGPTVFEAVTVDGDQDIGRGDYKVECLPGAI